MGEILLQASCHGPDSCKATKVSHLEVNGMACLHPLREQRDGLLNVFVKSLQVCSAILREEGAGHSAMEPDVV